MTVAATPAEIALEALIVEATAGRADSRVFARALVASEVYLLGSIDEDPSHGGTRGNPRIDYVVFDDQQGSLIPFFTSLPMLGKALRARPGLPGKYVKMGCRALMMRTAGSRLSLNPYDDRTILLPPEAVKGLLERAERG
jgi:hypothetical protein